MTNEEAKAIIRKEYLCVDRDCDIERSCGKCDLMMPSKEPILEAYKMAIKALEQMPVTTTAGEGGVIYYPQVEGVTPTVIDAGKQKSSGDAIDRKLVCAFIAGLISDDVEREKGLEYIRNMPPVNPMPCENAISRQAVIDSLHSKFADGFDSDRWWNSMSVLYAINKVPSVNPTKTGWIPVSERLPEICEKDCHGDITFSKTVIATQIYGNGYVYVGIDKYTTNNGGGWLSEVPFDNPDECCKVIAWMPLPKPYEPQERSDKE